MHVEHLLSKIEAPEYRRLCIETLVTLIEFVNSNPEADFDDYIVLDVVIGHAVRLHWKTNHANDSREYEYCKAEAWTEFYQSSPAKCRQEQLLAIKELSCQ